ncbi:MAG: hypothetical protein OXG78_01810 [Chloroflexi bacterium]|nr:hypothetical protein [Chloroflexota bacterium]
MSRKLKASPQRWLTASNLLAAHVAFHVLFVFGYWFSVAASLSFSGTDVIQNHGAILSDMLSNHLGLLIILVIHTGAVAANKWWGQRQHRGANEQFDSLDDHMTAEEKLELLLDEVVELREALHEGNVNAPPVYSDFSPQGRRDDVQHEEDELIELAEYRMRERALQS